MVVAERPKAVADKGIIFEMRRAGAPMREIAEAVGISKERVRQILARSLGSTRHGWLSTLQLCTLTGLPRNRILQLHDEGVISPSTTWGAGKRHYYLWPSDSAQKESDYYGSHHLCPVCQRQLPKNRIVFCSDTCRQERHKYKYMTTEEKQRVLANIRRYREKKRRYAEAALRLLLNQ